MDLPLPIDRENIAYYYQLIISMSIPLSQLKQYDVIKKNKSSSCFTKWLIQFHNSNTRIHRYRYV